MNIKWANMTGFGPTAWNHGSEPLTIPSMHYHHQEQKAKNVRAAGQQRPFYAPERGHLSMNHPEQGVAETKDIPYKAA